MPKNAVAAIILARHTPTQLCNFAPTRRWPWLAQLSPGVGPVTARGFCKSCAPSVRARSEFSCTPHAIVQPFDQPVHGWPH